MTSWAVPGYTEVAGYTEVPGYTELGKIGRGATGRVIVAPSGECAALPVGVPASG